MIDKSLRMPIVSLRNRLNWTQTELATALGVERNTIIRWEKDASDIPYSKTELLSQVLQYPKDGIFFGNYIALGDGSGRKSK